MEQERRIKKAINWLIYQELAENERDLSERLGYTKSSFSQIVNGKVPLSEKFVGKLCSLDENLNSVWILTGEGDMFRGGCMNGENNWNNVNAYETLSRALNEISEQRKLVAKAQEHIDRLITIIDNMQK